MIAYSSVLLLAISNYIPIRVFNLREGVKTLYIHIRLVVKVHTTIRLL